MQDEGWDKNEEKYRKLGNCANSFNYVIRPKHFPAKRNAMVLLDLFVLIYNIILYIDYILLELSTNY